MKKFIIKKIEDDNNQYGTEYVDAYQKILNRTAENIKNGMNLDDAYMSATDESYNNSDDIMELLDRYYMIKLPESLAEELFYVLEPRLAKDIENDIYKMDIKTEDSKQKDVFINDPKK